MTIELRTTAGRPPRVVIDTPVVVSALVFGGGASARLRQAWQAGECRPMLCQTTLADLGAKLAHPRLSLTRSEQSALLGEYVPHAVRVRVPGDDGRADVPMAVAFARLAMAGKAHAIVTSDPELLGLSERFICPVLTLDDLVRVLPTASTQPGR